MEFELLLIHNLFCKENLRLKHNQLFVIPQNYIDDVLQKVDYALIANFPYKKGYGLKVIQIPIIPTQIQFESNHNMNTIKGKNLLFVSNGDESNGSVLYFIIRNNEFYTFMFMKSYITIDTAKLRVDHILSNWNMIKANQIR